MATLTNQIDVPRQHLNLDQLSKVLMNRERVPVGFFVSQDLWDALASRWMAEQPFVTTEPVPTSFHGVRIAIDPDLPAAEFDVAFTDEAWTKRLRELSTPPASDRGTP